jgi:hypothetical protein
MRATKLQELEEMAAKLLGDRSQASTRSAAVDIVQEIAGATQQKAEGERCSPKGHSGFEIRTPCAWNLSRAGRLEFTRTGIFQCWGKAPMGTLPLSPVGRLN